MHYNQIDEADYVYTYLYYNFIRGSTKVYKTSPTMLQKTLSTAVIIATALIIGKSQRFTASITRLPSPGMLKKFSITTDPNSKDGKSFIKVVRIGTMRFLKTCLNKTTSSDNPFARAVRT
ncbi:protein of unknown function [Cardinium endosymbiont cEper1 of Encarsia pergandiella]|nr:protein of unknown function [Cardinium endosymbiont cEper1 of Encarsia pergandiella]